MQHLGTVELSTPRLLLRRFTMEDAAAMYANWGSNHKVNTYMVWPRHKNIADSQAALAEWTARYAEGDFYQWAVVLKELGQPIGSIGANYTLAQEQLAHIGYCIGSEWWGQGIMTEAFQAVIDFFFLQVGVNRVEAKHDARNRASGRVMEKCGLVYEGTHRQAGWNNQGLEDVQWYGILRQDYLRERSLSDDRPTAPNQFPRPTESKKDSLQTG